MKHLSLLIGVVLTISWVIPVEALRYPPGASGGGYVAVNLFGPTEVQSGDTFTYTVILTNDSSSFARDVQVTYAIPDGLKWLDRLGHQSCQQNINVIMCTIPLMQPGSESIPLRFTTDRLIYTNSTFCPRTISSSARVSTGSYDSFGGDNESPTLATRITCYDPPTRSYRHGIDLQLNLTTPRSITVGDSLNVSAVVTNSGTENAMFVTVLLSIPSGLSIHDIPRLCQVTGTMITCTNFSLRSGESRVLTFTVPIHSSYTCPSSLEWRAQVFSGSQTSYRIDRNALSRTSVACRPESSVGSSSSAPLTTDTSVQYSLNPSPSEKTGNYTPWINGTSWGTYNGMYADPLHVCDIPLTGIYPCPTENLRGDSKGSTGETNRGFGESDNGDSGRFGGDSGSAGGTSGGGTSGTTGGGGIFGGGTGGSSGGGKRGFFGGGTGGETTGDGDGLFGGRTVGSASDDGGTDGSVSGGKGSSGGRSVGDSGEDIGNTSGEISRTTGEESGDSGDNQWTGEWFWDGSQWTWTGNFPPDHTGLWVWTGKGWIFVNQESTRAAIDTDHEALQYCTGNEQRTITYEIETINRFEIPIENIDVVEMLNPTAVCIKDKGNGLIGPRHILWKISALAPRATHTIRYTVGLLPHVTDQFIIANRTHTWTSGPHILTSNFEMIEVNRQKETMSW